MKYQRAIVFCSNPVTGCLKFKDVFQIYPLVSEDAPKDKHISFYPLVLEYWISEDQQIEIPEGLKQHGSLISKLTATANYKDWILRFLSGFSNYYFFDLKPFLQWFISADTRLSEDEINNQTSVPGLNTYYYPTMARENSISSFTNVDFPEIEPKEQPKYFFNLDLDDRKEVDFPHLILGTFHNYILLDEKDKAAVDAALMLIYQGLELKTSKKSLSFLSFISSIETMVNHENREVVNERCGACGQEKYRVMAKFREYVLKYVANDPNAKKEIDAIYSLRSKIVHSGLLLLGDGIIDWTESEEKTKQEYTYLQAMQLSRLGLMNWILMRDAENKRKWNEKAALDISEIKGISLEAAKRQLEEEIETIINNSGMSWELASTRALRNLSKEPS